MARRRTTKRDARVVLVLVVLFIIIGTSIGLAVSKIITLLIIIIILAIALSIFAIIWNLPKIKGIRGEKTVSRILNRIANKYDGYVINDVIIPGNNEATSQIDHILFSRRGIFVVETKNYSGRLYGSGSQKQWTQVLAYGHTKNKMYNPIMQNQTHIFNLQKIIGREIDMFSCVVILGANISYLTNVDEVYTAFELKRMLKREAKNYKYDQNAIYNAHEKILEYKENPIATEKEHIQNIKKTQSDIEHNICPRCGGKLILRANVKTGSKFYGCEHYPDCKFTKKIN